MNHRNYSKVKWLSKAIEFDASSRCESVFSAIVTQHLRVSHSSSLGPQCCWFSGWKRKEEVGRNLNLQSKFELHKYKREVEVLPWFRLFFLKDSLFLTFEYGIFSGIRWLFTGTLFIVEAFHILFCRKLIFDYIKLLKETFKAMQFALSIAIFHIDEFKILHTNNSVVRRQ